MPRYNPKTMITDEQIEEVHAYASFGPMKKRDVVDQAVLKCAAGFHQGHTSCQIAIEHGLINDYPGHDYTLTKKGQEYLWAAFSIGNSV